LRLQLGDVDSLREDRPGGNALTDFDADLLQHAADAGAHLQRRELRPLQLVHRAKLFDLRAARGETGAAGVRSSDDPPFLELIAVVQLVSALLRDLSRDLRKQLLFRQRFIRVGAQARRFVFGFETRCLRFLTETLALQLRFEIHVLRFGAAKLQLGVERALHLLRIAELEKDRVGIHGLAGLHEHLLHTRFGCRRNPADDFRDERAGAANLAKHRSALDDVDPHGGPLDDRGGRLQLGDAERDAGQRDDADRAGDDPLLFLLLDDSSSNDIHGSVASPKRNGGATDVSGVKSLCR
jgi:hypothetical protein